MTGELEQIERLKDLLRKSRMDQRVKRILELDTGPSRGRGYFFNSPAPLIITGAGVPSGKSPEEVDAEMQALAEKHGMKAWWGTLDAPLDDIESKVRKK